MLASVCSGGNTDRTPRDGQAESHGLSPFRYARGATCVAEQLVGLHRPPPQNRPASVHPGRPRELSARYRTRRGASGETNPPPSESQPSWCARSEARSQGWAGAGSHRQQCCAITLGHSWAPPTYKTGAAEGWESRPEGWESACDGWEQGGRATPTLRPRPLDPAPRFCRRQRATHKETLSVHPPRFPHAARIASNSGGLGSFHRHQT